MNSNQLRRLRQNRLETQAELATKIGVHQVCISRLERGERGGDFRVRRRLAAELNVPVEQIWPDEATRVQSMATPAAPPRLNDKSPATAGL